MSTCIAISEPEYVGKIPVRQDVTVLPADGDQKLIGFSIFEKLGMAAVNPSAIQTVEINRCPDGCLEVYEDEYLSRKPLV